MVPAEQAKVSNEHATVADPESWAFRLRRREDCRVCGGDLRTVLDLGHLYLQGAFVKPGVSDPPRVRFPLELTRCVSASDGDPCGLVQLRHMVAPDLLYQTYWYRSRINDTMRDHLK